MNNEFVLKASLLFLAALAFSILINRLFLKFSKNLGIRNIDDKIIRWNTTSKPAFGGISFFIVFLLTLTVAPYLFDDFVLSSNLKLVGILIACSVGFLIGLTDDAYNTNPAFKSIGQAVCALILIGTGNIIEVFDITWLNYGFTFLWVVGLMNSINMLDNMDGVTTIASIFALISMMVVLLLFNNFITFYSILILGIMGALLGFLFFNWNPSRMYMGDTGSQFLGVSLAALSINILWNYTDESPVESVQFLLPLLAFLVPISDTTTVVINRISRGSSPFVGGKDHTTHHLSYLGFSDQSVALIVLGIGLISNVVILIALSINEWSHLFTILFSLYAIIVLVSLFLVTKPHLFGKKNETKERSIKKTA